MRSASVAHSRAIAGRYALEERLGRGRFGEIYSALDTRAANEGESQKRVAVQVVHSSVGGNAKLRERFTTGFARIRSWSHPNIVKLLELGREGGTLYVTMERLEGASMRQILDDLAPGTIDPDESLAVIRQIGDALRHAHARGMVHGDVRPDNVFITHDYAVKLLDFAPIPVSPLAVLVDDAPPQGSPLAKVRDDVYGLACLAYELLSGRHPFGGSLLDEARQAGLEPVPIAGIPRQQWQALKRALDLSAEVTPVSVSEFLDEFGITGTESLPIEEPSLPAPEPFGVARRSATPQPPLRYADEALTATRRQRAWEPPSPGPEVPAGGGRRILRPVVLALLAIALGVVTREYYWPMRAATADFYARYLPAILPGAETPPTDGAAPAAPEPDTDMATVRVDPSPIAPPVTIGAAAPTTTPPEASGDAEATAGALAGEPSPANGSAQSAGSMPIPADGMALSDGSMPIPADRPAAAQAGSPETPAAPAPLSAGNEAVPAEASSDPSPAAPAPAGAADRQQPAAAALPATIAFVDSFVTVPEFGSAARVVLRRSGGQASDPVEFRWWISEDTAIRDDDFADLGTRTASFEAGEPTATIFVPIIEDSRPEPNERFFVHVELQTEGAAARPMRAEVMIIDDDS